MNLPGCFKEWYRIVIVIFAPILIIPILLLFHSDAARCGYIVLLLLIYWISEAIPVPATSLLPIVLFPLAGVLKANEVAPNYFKDTTTFFFGSITLAYVIQRVNLHQRVALFVLTLVGSSVKWTMAGLMMTTYLLSMWINNAASTSIMLPVALAIASEYERHAGSSTSLNVNVVISDANISIEPRSEEQCTQENSQTVLDRTVKLRKGLILCVGYSSVYGGLSTIVGSAATIFLKAYVDEHYANTNFRLTFLNYTLLALPATTLMTITCWLWLQIRYNTQSFLSWRCGKNEHLKETLRQQYHDLGSLRWNELVVIILFLVAVTLWVTRDLAGGGFGWSALLPRNYVSNGTVALLIAILTMIFPDERPRLKNWKYNPILSWTDLSKNYPWGTLMLIGAGLSIAQAFQVSKLSNLLADTLQFVYNSSYLTILITILILSEICTQLINNLSIASILFPVISTLANNTNIHPASLLVPSTMALSLAFLLPISSQPNSVIFATGYIQTSDLITTGVMLTILDGFIVLLASSTWMIPILDLNRSFLVSNSTSNNLTLFNCIQLCRNILLFDLKRYSQLLMHIEIDHV